MTCSPVRAENMAEPSAPPDEHAGVKKNVRTRGQGGAERHAQALVLSAAAVSSTAIPAAAAAGGAAAPLSEAELCEVVACERAARRAHEMLLQAARSVCPPETHAVWDLPKEAVRPTAAPGGGADLQCRAPGTVWRRLSARARGGAVRVATVSEYGVRREAEYASAADLARAIVAQLAEASREVLADVRVRDDGHLHLTSQLHMRRQRAAGMLPCAACGGFYAGKRGLRDHQQIKHQTSYEEATEAVQQARGALVRYQATAEEARLAALWEARAAEAEASRHALPAGLAAARDGDVAALRRLATDGGWEVAAACDKHGSTAMMWAAGGGHLGACVELLSLGCDPRARQQKDGRTAMHWAARNGHLGVCRWLVAQGCDADAPTHDGTTPLHWAVWQGHLPVCRWLVEVGPAEAEEGAAAEAEAEAEAEAAPASPLADVNRRNAYGCNAVQWAAQSDGEDVAMCRWLLGAGCDLSLLNFNGHSAVHKAALKGRRSVCEWLLDPRGANLGLTHLRADGDGNTPARMARAEGFVELGEWLERAGLRLSGGDGRGEAVLDS